MTRTAVYPGSFDPVTLGHEDIIRDPAWLGEFAASVEMAVGGKVRGKAREVPIAARAFIFGAFSVWLPL